MLLFAEPVTASHQSINPVDSGRWELGGGGRCGPCIGGRGGQRQRRRRSADGHAGLSLRNSSTPSLPRRWTFAEFKAVAVSATPACFPSPRSVGYFRSSLFHHLLVLPPSAPSLSAFTAGWHGCRRPWTRRDRRRVPPTRTVPTRATPCIGACAVSYRPGRRCWPRSAATSQPSRSCARGRPRPPTRWGREEIVAAADTGGSRSLRKLPRVFAGRVALPDAPRFCRMMRLAGRVWVLVAPPSVKAHLVRRTCAAPMPSRTRSGAFLISLVSTSNAGTYANLRTPTASHSLPPPSPRIRCARW